MAFNRRMDKKDDRVHHSSKSDRQHSFGGSHGAGSEDRTEHHRKDDRKFGGFKPSTGRDQPEANRFDRSESRPRFVRNDSATNRDAPRSDNRYGGAPAPTREQSEGRTYERSERTERSDSRPSYNRTENSSYSPRNDSRDARPSRGDYNSAPKSYDRPRSDERPRFDDRRSDERPRTEERARFSDSRPQARSDSRSFERQPFEKRSFDSKPSYSRDGPRKSYDRPQRDGGSSNFRSSNIFSETPISGVFEFKGNIYTRNANPGQIVYGEKVFTWDGVEYRFWDAMRSKLGAGIKKGIKEIGITPGCTVLYLGCSTGTTVSHVAEIVGDTGIVYALDVAPRVMRDMTLLAKKRHNIYPLMADANRPTTFAHAVPIVDTIFMDIAQSNQTEIFLKNVHAFLKDGGFALLSLKSRSIDITKTPNQVYAEARALLEKEVDVLEYKTLDPFEKDHALFVCRKR